MARCAVQYRLDHRGEFRPVGVWLATLKALQSRFIPGRLDEWVGTVYREARLATGETWESWLDHALLAFSNGHDLHAVEVPPELTVDLAYARYVLGLPEAHRGDFAPRTIGGLSEVPIDAA